MGPRLDLVGLLTDAIRRRGMKILVSMHHAYNITGFYEAAPKTDDPKLKMLYGQQSKDENEALWLDKHKEVIDGYRPDVIWQDFNLHRISEPVLLQFLAYYYNRAVDWGKEVVATYKDGLNPRCAVLDYERGGPPDIKEDYWLTDDAISSTSWSYTDGIRYYSQKQVFHGFLDRISKNGNLLLNISPRADGTIPQEQRDLLLAMGAWLRKYGEAVYSTRAWDRYGEGPTKMGAAHGVMGPPSEGTARDVRYTRSKDNSTLYAILLGWEAGQKEITLEALSSERIDGSKLRSVALLKGRDGASLPLAFEQSIEGLHVRLPERSFDELAYVLRLTFDGKIPPYDGFAVLDGTVHYSLVPAGNRDDLVLGSELSLTRRRKELSSQWKLEPVGHGVHRLLNRADPSLALTRGSDHGVEPLGVQWRRRSRLANRERSRRRAHHLRRPEPERRARAAHRSHGRHAGGAGRVRHAVDLHPDGGCWRSARRSRRLSRHTPSQARWRRRTSTPDARATPTRIATTVNEGGALPYGPGGRHRRGRARRSLARLDSCR